MKILAISLVASPCDMRPYHTAPACTRKRGLFDYVVGRRNKYLHVFTVISCLKMVFNITYFVRLLKNENKGIVFRPELVCLLLISHGRSIIFAWNNSACGLVVPL